MRLRGKRGVAALIMGCLEAGQSSMFEARFRERRPTLALLLTLFLCVTASGGVASSRFCVFCVSVCPNQTKLTPTPPTPVCHIAIERGMFPLLMHTDAQRLTGADSMKRGAAEINTYVMREREATNGWPICVCQGLSEGLRN